MVKNKNNERPINKSGITNCEFDAKIMGFLIYFLILIIAAAPKPPTSTDKKVEIIETYKVVETAWAKGLWENIST